MEHALCKKVPPEVLALFREIEKLLESDLDPGRGRLIDCHELSEALSGIYTAQLRSCFGVFAGISPHSWLETLDGDWLIDPYPISCLGGPLLIKRHSRWFHIYQETEQRPFLMRAKNFPGRVRRTRDVLEKALSRLRTS